MGYTGRGAVGTVYTGQGVNSTPTFAVPGVGSGLTGVIIGNGASAFTASPITQYDVLVGGASNAITSISPSTSGYVLTSNGTGANPTFQAASGGSGIVTIDGNFGSVTGSTVVIRTAETGGQLTEGTSQFVATGTSLIQTFTTQDGFGNTAIGTDAGLRITGGYQNNCFGLNAGQSITSGNWNQCFGVGAGNYIQTGTYNIAIGHAAYSTLNANDGSFNTLIGAYSGTSYTSSESSNILIGYNTLGTVSESNVCRIGNGTGTGNGQIAKTFIAGITGVTPSGSTLATVNSSGQLGDSGISNVQQVLKASSTVNMKSATAQEIFTGFKAPFVLVDIILYGTNVTGTTTNPFYSIGWTGPTYSDFFTTFSTYANSTGLYSPGNMGSFGGNFPVFPASTPIYINVTSADTTATTDVQQIYFVGYYLF